MTALLIGSAPENKPDYIKNLAEKADLIICADGGMRYAERFGIKPDIAAGDFDSGKKPKDIPALVFPAEKDDSDLMCCVKYALGKKADKILLACASGGRIDHFLCNLSILEYLDGENVQGIFYDSQNRVRFHGGGKKTYARDDAYKYIGIIPLDERLENVTLTGLKYPLKNAVITREHIISISNEAVSDSFCVEIGCGRALVTESVG